MSSQSDPADARPARYRSLAEEIDPGMMKVEVNLDDAPGQLLGHVMELLFEAGANDVFYSPIYMKKNRPAVMLQLLCSADHLPKMESILFRETTTLGIRSFPLTVHRLARRFMKVATEYGEVTVKVGSYEGEVVQRAPEYEECRAIARTKGLPLKLVYEAVWRALARSTPNE